MLPELAGKKVLLVSSAGGHLTELVTLANAAGVRSDSMWVVPETAQSHSLLHGKRTTFVPYVGPRAIGAAMRAAGRVASILQAERFDYCISTGAAIAAFTLPLASSRRIASIYIESLTRAHGPSLTGRILRRVPGVNTMTQSPSWASKAWPYAGTVIDEYSTARRDQSSRSLRILITLGTIRPYRFDRAVDAILSTLQPTDRVVWQLGTTFREGLPGDTYREMSSEALLREMEGADVVVAHAGAGSILDALTVGRFPLLLVRQRSYGEHVDDHQRQLAEVLTKKGLGEEFNIQLPDRQQLLRAASLRVQPTRRAR